MALAATTIWEVETGGNDTNNGGAFDPGQTAGMFTDGAATSANTAAPVFTSASYNFVAGDAGAWVYVASGTNWLAGWYKISSVAANAATLDATIGHAVLKAMYPNTATGCATTASPTTATWTIDYSQQASPIFSYADLASAGAGLTVSSAAHPFAKQQVGNCLVVTSGTNFTAGRYVIASVAASVATVVGPGNITTGVGSAGVGGLGGALASPGQVNVPAVANNTVCIKSGTYSITSATTNVAAGCVSDTVGKAWEGYGSVRGDVGTAPLLQASGISTFTLFNKSTNGVVRNLTLDAASLTSGRGFTTNSQNLIQKVTAKNCTNIGLNQSASASTWVLCVATGCATTAPAFSPAGGQLYGCEAYSNTVTGFGSITGTLVNCLAYSNSGASSDGFGGTSGSNAFFNCVAYANGRDGYRFIGTTNAGSAVNCIAEANTGSGYNAGGVSVNYTLTACAAYNNGTNVNTTNLTGPGVAVGVTILSSSPFNNAAAGDFSLNTNTNAGAACRGFGTFGTTPDGLSVGHMDIGAIQSGSLAVPGNIYLKFGSSNQAITITIASLAASATVGRQATPVDNSATFFEDVIIEGLFDAGVVAGNKQALFYVAASADGGTTYSGQNGTNVIGGADAGFTRLDPTDLKLLGVVGTPTASVKYSFGPYSIVDALGYMPDHWCLVVFNDTGAAFSGTAGNNKAWYQGIYHQYT